MSAPEAKAPEAASKAPASASLYVGDLHRDVTEQDLFEQFSPHGQVVSVKVCREAVTKNSLGYGYVNFTPAQAENARRAMQELNYTPLRGQPMRIMWVRRDPTLRKSGKGNIFIKNLHPDIDHRTLYETMSENVGPVLSCRIPMFPDGTSKGYGFVHFENEEDAEQAVEKLNGKVLNGLTVVIERFKRKAERPNAMTDFKNVYVKNVPKAWSEEEFLKRFKEHGEVTNAKLQEDPTGEGHKGFGFVNYATHEQALKAIEALHDSDVGEGVKLYVQRAQSKAERERLLRQEKEERQRQWIKEMEGRNIFVKNLPDTWDDNKLRELFEDYGTIQSAKVMMSDDGVSRCFGFVCFSTQEEAQKAITGRNQTTLEGGKPLFCALAQRKEVRQQQLQRQMNMMGGPGIMPYSFAPFGMPGAARPGMPPTMMMPPFMGGMRPGRGGPMGRGMGPGFMMAGRGRGGRGMGIAGGRGGRGQGPGRGRGMRPPVVQPVSAQGRPERAHAVDEQAAVMPAPDAPQAQVPGASGAQPLTLAQLASASEGDRKRMLGERLYPLVEQHRRDMAAKITGMFLELDTNEVINLIEDGSYLQTKMQEAVEVLRQHGLIAQDSA
ncbi:unnamed protein product [Pedinophyceae sp. YPF-701]|nr:unnamed protein product [Pedinophyceae sp. YPF-701]